jgi:hypothetical protein
VLFLIVPLIIVVIFRRYLVDVKLIVGWAHIPRVKGAGYPAMWEEGLRAEGPFREASLGGMRGDCR